MNHRATPHPFKEWINRHAILIPFVVLAVAVSLAFYLDQQNQEADQKQRCLTGVDTRNVDRAQVQGFYVFVKSLLPPDDEIRKLTPEQQDSIKNTKKNLDRYRKDLYNLIHPSVVCAKYVTDINVQPPKTPDLNVVVPPRSNKGTKP